MSQPSATHGFVLGRDQLVGTWDLVSARHPDGRRADSNPNGVGLMTCSADGTFTFQMGWSDGAVVSTWGHFQWLAPHRLVHVVEWDTDQARVGTSKTFEVEDAGPTHLAVVSDDGLRFVFER